MKVETVGTATLYLGDCLDVLPTLKEIEAIVTDPPYGTGGWRRTQSGQGSNPKAQLVREDWDSGATEWLGDVPCRNVVTFWPSSRMPELMAAATRYSFEKVRMLYMRKLDPKPQMKGRVAWSVEPIVCLSPLGFQLYGGTDLIDASTPRLGRDTDASGHPYQKPLMVMEWLIAKARVASICDPFMGSGTTGVACAKQGRRFVGIEREPKYFEIACERIDAAHKQQKLFA